MAAKNAPTNKEDVGSLRKNAAQRIALFHKQGQRRRSRSFIFWLKLVLPIGAVLIVAYVFFWSRSQLLEKRISVEVAENSENPIDKTLRVSNVHYDGRDSKGRPYSLFAETVTKYADSETMELTRPRADITLGSGWVALVANHGTYHRQEDNLDLAGDVEVFYDNGTAFETDSAHINFKEQTADGRDSVLGHGNRFELLSQGFQVLNDGQLVVFTGRTHMTLYPIMKKDKSG